MRWMIIDSVRLAIFLTFFLVRFIFRFLGQAIVNPFSVMLYWYSFNWSMDLFGLLRISEDTAIAISLVIIGFLIYMCCHLQFEDWMSCGGYGSRLMMGLLHVSSAFWLVSVFGVFAFGPRAGVSSFKLPPPILPYLWSVRQTPAPSPIPPRELFIVMSVLTVLAVVVAFSAYLRRLPQSYLRRKGGGMGKIPTFREWFFSINWP